MSTFFFGHPPWSPGRVQRSTIRFEKSISKILYQTLCLFSRIKEMGFFIMSPRSYSRGTWGCLWVNFFPNTVVWHIKLKGMVSRTGNKLNVHPMVKLVTLRYSQ